LVRTNGENHVTENEVRTSRWGLLLAASERDAVIFNQFSDNDVGVLLTQLGKGTRIEGNTISGNDVGLRQVASLVELEDELGSLGIVLPENPEPAIPVLANNRFMDNADYDIQNQTLAELLAAGNWWGAASVRDPRNAVVSDGVSLDQSAWRGVVAIGTGTDDVRVLLGRILQLALAEEGFRVVDLVGMGPSERVRQALLDADVDLICWSGSSFESADPAEGSPSMLLPTSAREGWRIIVSALLADRLTEPTVAGLADWAHDSGEHVRYTATSRLGDARFQDFLDAYGLAESVRSITQSDALEEVEALLKFGAVDVAIVGSLDETLTLSGFLAIDDGLQVLDQNPISMIVQQSIVTKYPEAQDILEALGARLTSEVLHDLVSRIRLLRREPEDVAREWLQQ
jgi:glycine betaine/choline ABC-type transport system substrate-binding protein